MLEVGRRVVFELVGILDGQELEAFGQLALQERGQRLGRDPEGGGDLVARLHLLHGDVVGNERRLHVDAELLEDDRPGIGGGRALRIEVHHLAGEILQRVDLGPHEHDAASDGKQVQQVVDPPPGAGELGLGLEVVQHVAIDDGRIDAAQIEQVVDVVERPARDDRQHAHVVAVVEHAGELGGELQRRALEPPGGEADCPGVDAFLLRLLGRRGVVAASRRRAASGLWLACAMSTLRAGACVTGAPTRWRRSACACAAKRARPGKHRAEERPRQVATQRMGPSLRRDRSMPPQGRAGLKATQGRM